MQNVYIGLLFILACCLYWLAGYKQYKKYHSAHALRVSILQKAYKLIILHSSPLGSCPIPRLINESYNRLSRKHLHLINVYSNHNTPKANLNNRVNNGMVESDWLLAEFTY